MKEFERKFGKAICVLLYARFAALAAKKRAFPLLLLLGTHLCEYCTKARPLAEKLRIGQDEALVNCLAFGFLWWKPLEEGKKS